MSDINKIQALPEVAKQTMLAYFLIAMMATLWFTGPTLSSWLVSLVQP